jgi:hypothetical protein
MPFVCYTVKLRSASFRFPTVFAPGEPAAVDPHRTGVSFLPTMGMTHSSSGKRGFGAYVQPTSFQFPKETLKNILIREDELRASEEVRHIVHIRMAADHCPLQLFFMGFSLNASLYSPDPVSTKIYRGR